MTRKINAEGIKLLKQWEGCKLTAYRDSAGVLTIGYGHTSAAGEPAVYAGMKITAKQAEEMLKQDLGQYEKTVEDAVKVPLTDNQFAALVSFTYNVGPAAFRRSSLLKKLNKGNCDAIPAELAKWNKAGGKVLKGLSNRRAAESYLWAKGEFVASRDVQPAPVRDNPFKKPAVIGPVIGAASGLTGFATGAGPFQWALAAVMVIGALTGAWYFIRRMMAENA